MAAVDDLPVGVTPNAGIAFVGNVGAATVMDFTAFGDAVNVSTRLQAHASPGEVVLPSDFYALVAADYPAVRSERAGVRGRGEPSTWTGGKVMLLGSGTQPLAPLYRDDVVKAILHAGLDPETPIGTFEFAGPDIMTAQEFARLVNSEPIRIRRVPAMLARLLGRVVPTFTPDLVDVMLADTVPTEDVTATARLFGVELHRPAEVWPPQ